MKKKIKDNFEIELTSFVNDQINEIKKTENPDISVYTGRLLQKWDELILRICNDNNYDCNFIIKTPISNFSNGMIIKMSTFEIYQNQSQRIFNEIIN